MPADTWEVTPFLSLYLFPRHLSRLSISIFSSKGFVRLLCARVCELLYAFFGNVYFRSVLGSDYDRPRMKLVLRVDETVGVVFTVCRMTGA